jgi:hypothetical protein
MDRLKLQWFFFFQIFGWVERVFFMFPSSSQRVPIMFPMCSPKVFPIAHCFHPICFAQSPPLLTYIPGTKEGALHHSIESFILQSFHSFNFFWQWANQIDSLHKKNWTWEPHQLINKKQNKYPQLCPLTAYLFLRLQKVLRWVLNVLYLTLVWSLDTGDAGHGRC